MDLARRSLSSRPPALCLALALGSIGCSEGVAVATPPVAMQADESAKRVPATPVYGYRVVSEFPHDAEAFTQGLTFAGIGLYESTGSYGSSELRRVDPSTGEILQRRSLEPRYFGEGLAAVDDRLIQLTWRSQRGFVYDRASLEPIGEFRYSGEGWGLTYDGNRLILSDGTEALRFYDPKTYVLEGSVRVVDAGRPVRRINELEYIDGEVWANIWQANRIARIDPESGRVVGWIDLAGIIRLKPVLKDGQLQNVLNGIAHDPNSGRLFVTGKLWPTLFEIELVSPAK